MAVKPTIPTTLAPRKQQWETHYEAMVHPSLPVPPPNYVSAIPDGGEEDVNVVDLSVLNSNLGLLVALPQDPLRRMNPFLSNAIEHSDDIAVANILMNIQHQSV